MHEFFPIAEFPVQGTKIPKKVPQCEKETIYPIEPVPEATTVNPDVYGECFKICFYYFWCTGS